MCDVLSGIAAALSIASTAAGTASGAIGDIRQAKAIDEANKHNAEQAIKEMGDLAAQEGITQQQERMSLGNEKLSLKREAMQKSATAKASLQSSGGAYDAVLNDYARADGNNMSVIDQQLAMQGISHDLAYKSYADRARARLDSLPTYSNPAWLQALGYLGSGLQIGGKALGAWADIDELQKGRSLNNNTSKNLHQNQN